MTRVFIYRSNCKNSKQVLDIFAITQPSNMNTLNLSDLSERKEEYILGKYKIRDVPCIVEGDNIMYSSEMFSYIKNLKEPNDKQETGGFFMGLGSGASSMYSQEFKPKTCSCNETVVCNCYNESGFLQDSLHPISGIDGTPHENQPAKSKGKKNKSSVDRSFEKLLESRNKESQSQQGPVHNNRIDFSQPMSRI